MNFRAINARWPGISLSRKVLESIREKGSRKGLSSSRKLFPYEGSNVVWYWPLSCISFPCPAKREKNHTAMLQVEYSVTGPPWAIMIGLDTITTYLRLVAGRHRLQLRNGAYLEPMSAPQCGAPLMWSYLDHQFLRFWWIVPAFNFYGI